MIKQKIKYSLKFAVIIGILVPLIVFVNLVSQQGMGGVGVAAMFLLIPSLFFNFLGMGLEGGALFLKIILFYFILGYLLGYVIYKIKTKK